MEELEEELCVLLEEELEEDDSTVYSLVVYNDEVNTFMNVIISLMENCDIDETRARECTQTIHDSGECVILKGSVKDLIIMRNGLNMDGIDAEVELEIEEN